MSPFYPRTSSSLAGSASLTNCGSSFCRPAGTKIVYIDSSTTGLIVIPATVPPFKLLQWHGIQIH